MILSGKYLIKTEFIRLNFNFYKKWRYFFPTEKQRFMPYDEK